jgi:hypothetical protein
MPLIKRLTFLFILVNFHILAQPGKMVNNKENYNFMLGASWILLDDDGIETNPINFSQYHSVPFPTRFFIDKYLYNGWSVEGSISYQKYDSTKYTNDSLGINGNLFSLDGHSKYSFYKLLGRKLIDPYVLAGAGITTRKLDERNTAKGLSISANVGVGVNFWFSEYVGVQLQSLAKFSLNDLMGPSNYIVHSAGVIVRLQKPNANKSSFAKARYKVKKSRAKINVPKNQKRKKDS